MTVDELIQAGKTSGVDGNDVMTMYRHGLTPAMAQKASSLGLSVKDLWQLHSQFGPPFIPMANALLNRVNVAPAPKPAAPSGPAEDSEEG